MIVAVEPSNKGSSLFGINSLSLTLVCKVRNFNQFDFVCECSKYLGLLGFQFASFRCFNKSTPH